VYSIVSYALCAIDGKCIGLVFLTTLMLMIVVASVISNGSTGTSSSRHASPSQQSPSNVLS